MRCQSREDAESCNTLAGSNRLHAADCGVPVRLLHLPRHLLAAMAAGGRCRLLPVWPSDAHRPVRCRSCGQECRLSIPGLPRHHLLCRSAAHSHSLSLVCVSWVDHVSMMQWSKNSGAPIRQCLRYLNQSEAEKGTIGRANGMAEISRVECRCCQRWCAAGTAS